MPPSRHHALEPHADDKAAPPAGEPAGLDGADAAFAGLVAVIGVWSWVGIALVEAGRFHLTWLLLLAAPASAAAAAVTWRRLRAGARSAGTGRTLAALVVVAALAAWLGARPGEFLVDGSDGSVYLNIGRSIARHHALTYAEPILDLLPPAQWEAVLQRERYPPRIFNLFPGGIQVYPGVNAVEPNFFHLLPVWVAIADLIGGPHAAYYVSPASSVVAIVAFWLLARGFTSALPATLVSLLLLANYAQIWFARMPTTEVMTQAFTLSGLYFAVACYRRPEVTLGVLSALAFGMAAFVRIDVLMLVLPVVAGFLVLVAVERRWHRAWTWLAVVLAALTAHAVGHAILASTPYTERILFHAFRGRSVTTGSRLTPALVLVTGALALLLARMVGMSARVRTVAWWLFALVVILATVRILPQLGAGFLLLLLTPFGAGVVVVGTALWLTGDRTGPTALVLGLLLVSTLVYGESVRDRSELPMVLRRYVPIVLPLATLAIGVLIDRAWRQGRPGRLAALAIWATLLALWVAPSRPIIAAAPMQGVHDELGRLAALLPADAIVVTDATSPSHFGLSLHGSFNRDVLWVRPTEATAVALESLARRGGRRLVIVRAGSGAEPGALTARDVARLDLSPARTDTLRISRLAPEAGRLPSAIVSYDSALEFYLARPRDASAMPVTVEIGAGDLAGRISGFHGAEQMGEASARWTDAQALIQLPVVPVTARATLVLRVAAPRGAGMAAPRMRVALDGVEVGTTPPLAAGFQQVDLPLPDASRARLAANPSVLILSVATFVPAEHGMGGDTRPLGAVVDWVRVDAR